MQGQTLPTGASAFAIASVLPRDDATQLLHAWGFDDMAEALGEHVPDRVIEPNIDYRLETHSKVPSDTVPIGWKTTVEVLGRVETSQGVSWILQTESGSLLLANPILSFTGNRELAEALQQIEPDQANGEGAEDDAS